MHEQHGSYQKESGVKLGSEALFLVEIEEGDLPVVEPETLLQSQIRVEIRLHGEHVNHDQDRHDGPERERHPLGAKRIRGQGLHSLNVDQLHTRRELLPQRAPNREGQGPIFPLAPNPS